MIRILRMDRLIIDYMENVTIMLKRKTHVPPMEKINDGQNGIQIKDVTIIFILFTTI